MSVRVSIAFFCVGLSIGCGPAPSRTVSAQHVEALPIASSIDPALVLADALRSRGKTSDAINTALAAPSSIPKDKLLLLLVKISIDAGNLAPALTAALAIHDSPTRDSAMLALIVHKAQRGNIHAARVLVPYLHSALAKAEGHAELGSVLAQKGYAAQARPSLEIAATLALTAFASPRRDMVFFKLATAWQKENRHDLARKARDRIASKAIRSALRTTKPMPMDPTNSRISSAVQRGDINGALSLVNWASDDAQRNRALGFVVGELTASRAYEMAVSVAQGLRDDQNRARALRRIAEANLTERIVVYDAQRASPTTSTHSQTRIESDTKPILSVLGTDLFEAGESFAPALKIPSLTNLRAGDIAAALPPVSPGRAALIPLLLDSSGPKYVSGLVETALASFGGTEALAAAQGSEFPFYLYLDSGIWDVPTLSEWVSKQGGSNVLIHENRIYTLKIPLLIGPRARLLVTGADVKSLRLSAQGFAFVAVSGALHTHDTEIVGWDQASNSPAKTDLQGRQPRPFIVVWSAGTADFGATHIQSLGFNAPRAYGLTFAEGPWPVTTARALAPPTGRLLDNSISDLFYGFYSDRAADVSLVGNHFDRNIVYAIDPHDYSERLLMALNTTTNTALKHGIIISRGVDYSKILGNLVTGNAGTGIMLDRNSQNTQVIGNRVWRNGGAGVAVFESPCAVIAANVFATEGSSAVVVRNAWNISLLGNDVSANGKLGLEVFSAALSANENRRVRDPQRDGYRRFTSIIAQKNVFRGESTAAIGHTGTGTVSLFENTISPSAKRPYGGNLDRVASALVAATGSGRRVVSGPREFVAPPCAGAPMVANSP